jgi:hypothetical protein
MGQFQPGTKSLLASIFLHLLNNLLAFGLMKVQGWSLCGFLGLDGSVSMQLLAIALVVEGQKEHDLSYLRWYQSGRPYREQRW